MSDVNINDYVKNTGFGTGANRAKFEDDGTLKFEGDSTVWDDIVGSLIGKSLSSTAGQVDYSWAENAISFGPNGDIATEADLINFSVQVPHSAKYESNLDLHIHWEQIDSTAREFTIHHRIQSNGSAKSTAWTENIVSTQLDDKFTYTSGTLNQISDMIQINMSGVGISAIIQFKITRSDSVAGDINVTFMDIHVEKDTLGSRQEYVK